MERLGALKGELARYAGLVEQMVNHSLKGLCLRQRELCEEVIRADEPRANEWEVAIEQMGTTIIAQFNPVAKDLRTVLMILKANNDLERMADHAVNIAESALFLMERPYIKRLIDLPRMAEIVASMLRDAVTSFIAENPSVAEQVCERDDIVDGLQDQILRELITCMVNDPLTIERAIHCLRIGENLERIADLSTNLCEDTIYMVQGRTIKHHRADAAGGKTVLFVCVENSCRSQMAEGFARALGRGKVIAYSAGSSPSGIINPDAVTVMAEVGIDISSQKSKGFDALPVKEVDYLVTMGCEKTCPAFEAKEYVAWEIEDPKGRGIEAFRKARDEIRQKVEELLKKIAGS